MPDHSLCHKSHAAVEVGLPAKYKTASSLLAAGIGGKPSLRSWFLWQTARYDSCSVNDPSPTIQKKRTRPILFISKRKSFTKQFADFSRAEIRTLSLL